MFCCNAFCAVWFTAILIAEPIELAQQYHRVQASEAITVGMSADDVRSILGEPDAIFEYQQRRGFALWLFGPRPKQWMYGTVLNLDHLIVPNLPFPNPFPINLRIFHYAPEDLVINWSPRNRVADVRRPAFDLPETADAMLDAANFVEAFFRLIVSDSP